MVFILSVNNKPLKTTEKQQTALISLLQVEQQINKVMLITTLLIIKETILIKHILTDLIKEEHKYLIKKKILRLINVTMTVIIIECG